MREKLKRFVAALKVVLRSLPAWLATASVALTVVAAEVVPLLPEGSGLQVAGWIATGLLWCGAIARTVARLTPVPESQRGILPPPPPPAPADYPRLPPR